MKHPVDILLDGERVRNLARLEPEALIRQGVGKTRRAAGEKGVEANDVPSLVKEPFAEMGADEAGAAGYDRSRHVNASPGQTLARCRSTRSLFPSPRPARTGSARPR